MIDFDKYIQENEPDRREKSYAWQTAIGLQAVDGLRPSDYLVETARRHIEGDITIDEVRRLIDTYYQSKSARLADDEGKEEADKVSANIARLLGERSFAFTMAGLLAVHRRVFDGVFKFAGQIREYNITKKEWVLGGDTVLYVSAPDIRRAIEYDLEQERAFNYAGLSMEQIVSHVAKFVSGLWQIHPFAEGNTRTTAVFAIQYLRSMGFLVENELFAKHSWYFRNALVRANYQNLQKGIVRDGEYLERFFRNLLLGTRYELKNRIMLVLPQEETREKLPTEELVRTSTEQVTEQLRALLAAIGDGQVSLRQLMEKLGWKHRPTFLEKYMIPAINGGFVKLLYPEKPNHPRQRYVLTVKGMVCFNQL